MKIFSQDGILNCNEWIPREYEESDEFENHVAMIQLNKLFESMNKDHKLVKLFYHLTIFSFLNKRYADNDELHTLKVVQRTFIPFDVFDKESLSTKKIIKDYATFFTLYPIFIPKIHDLKDGTLEDKNDKALFTEEHLVDYLSLKQNDAEILLDDYFKSLISKAIIFIYDQDRDNEPSIENFMTVFPNFDTDYAEKTFYSLTKEKLKNHLSISSLNYGISFGYEGLESQSMNYNRYSLNLKSFIDSII